MPQTHGGGPWSKHRGAGGIFTHSSACKPPLLRGQARRLHASYPSRQDRDFPSPSSGPRPYKQPLAPHFLEAPSQTLSPPPPHLRALPLLPGSCLPSDVQLKLCVLQAAFPDHPTYADFPLLGIPQASPSAPVTWPPPSGSALLDVHPVPLVFSSGPCGQHRALYSTAGHGAVPQ